MYVAQQCFGLSDEGIEDAIYDSQAIRAFVCIDLNRVYEGQVVGAVDVSGVKATQDAQIAKAGIAALTA